MNKELSINVKNLTKKFGDFYAVNNITFDVKKGEIFGFLGANGAGKTTAMKILCGILSPTSGEAEVAGVDIFKNSEKVKEKIGYMSQKFSLYNDLNPLENIEFYGSIYGIGKKEIKIKAEEIMENLGLQEYKKKLVKDLPLGWKQKLSFSVAAIHNPGIIFLDEPTGGVDPITRREFWYMIYERASQGTTIFVTTHYMDEAEYCDRISMMRDGKIVALGSPSELKSHFDVKDMNQVFLKIARD